MRKGKKLEKDREEKRRAVVETLKGEKGEQYLKHMTIGFQM